MVKPDTQQKTKELKEEENIKKAEPLKGGDVKQYKSKNVIISHLHRPVVFIPLILMVIGLSIFTYSIISCSGAVSSSVGYTLSDNVDTIEIYSVDQFEVEFTQDLQGREVLLEYDIKGVNAFDLQNDAMEKHTGEFVVDLRPVRVSMCSSVYAVLKVSPDLVDMKLSIHATNGDVKITGNDIRVSSLEISSTNGLITVFDVLSTSSISISNTNGEISIYTTADKMTLTTTNGAIYGQVNSPQLIVSTTNEPITLRDYTPGNHPEITLSTTNAPVEFEIFNSNDITGQFTLSSSNDEVAIHNLVGIPIDISANSYSFKSGQINGGYSGSYIDISSTNNVISLSLE
eukprot:TRINITY_DN4418_c0_g1_i1.p1 TRINITY_DN4418_c0_g1~~TRINITY_DN4418_c0_g1_i1.p1  ORF type:complete len:344 (+),score=76.60 TRINITY_DN4418_c0_g1_i1:162-1193(+)